jgi:membrane protein
MDERSRPGVSGSAGVPRAAIAAGRQWGGILRAAIDSWLADRAPSMGAAIAYYTVFSLAPILVLVIAIAGLAFGKAAAEGALFNQIAALVGKESASAVQALLRSASSTASGIVATVAGLVMLVIAATGVFGEVQAALNVIWKAKPTKEEGLWKLAKMRLRSLALIVGIGILLAVSLVLSTALEAFSAYLSAILPALPYVLTSLNFLFSIAITTVLFAMVFKILPDTRIDWEEVWIGAFATALLFTFGRHLITLYIGTGGVSSVYHAAGTLVLLLVWIYYSAQILLFGAEFAKAHSDHRRAQRARSAAIRGGDG